MYINMLNFFNNDEYLGTERVFLTVALGHNHIYVFYYLVELVGNNNTEYKSKPDGRVKEEEHFAPSLAWIRS